MKRFATRANTKMKYLSFQDWDVFECPSQTEAVLLAMKRHSGAQSIDVWELPEAFKSFTTKVTVSEVSGREGALLAMDEAP